MPCLCIALAVPAVAVGAMGPLAPEGFFLLETGDHLLLETGDSLLL